MGTVTCLPADSPVLGKGPASAGGTPAHRAPQQLGPSPSVSQEGVSLTLLHRSFFPHTAPRRAERRLAAGREPARPPAGPHGLGASTELALATRPSLSFESSKSLNTRNLCNLDRKTVIHSHEI